jgi:hypothetical protein
MEGVKYVEERGYLNDADHRIYRTVEEQTSPLQQGDFVNMKRTMWRIVACMLILSMGIVAHAQESE